MTTLPKPQEPEHPPGVTLYDHDDYDTQRQLMYDNVKQSFAETYPASYGGVRLELNDLDYDGPEHFTRAEQKQALLTNGTLTRRLRGTMRLIDEDTGETLDERKTTLMKVPVLTDRGTYIHNGNEIGAIRQARLIPGVYTRRQANGELESMFNARVGTGRAFRVGLESKTGQYRMKVAQSNLHLYSLLKDLGVPDEQLEKSWGPSMLKINQSKYDSQTLDRAYKKMVHEFRRDPNASKEDKAAAVRSALEEIQISKKVAQKNLPNWFDHSKSAFWKEAAEVKPIVTELMDQTYIKKASFTEPELDAVITFLNTNHTANLPTQASVPEKEEAVIAFVSGNSDTNYLLAQTAQKGLDSVRDQNDFLPKI
jgi:DNA-directed RNA polymerase beta subunit